MDVPSRAATKFDETFDVVVAGYGYAGGISAIMATDSGARVLLIEKASVPGGISICSYGAVRCAKDKRMAFDYLKRTNAGRTPGRYRWPQRVRCRRSSVGRAPDL